MCRIDLLKKFILVDFHFKVENENGKITWKDFIPIGIKAVQIFLERNKRLAKQTDAQKEINKDSLRLVYDHEIKKANTIMQRRF